MQDAQIIFVIPDATNDIAKVLSDNYATLEGMETTEIEADVALYLAAHTGEVASVDFPDADNPLDGMLPLVALLKNEKSVYFGVTPSFEERSRGMRAEGRVFLSLDGQDFEETFNWVDGDPELHERTLKAVGVPADVVAKVESTFFSSSPAPKV